MKDRKNPKDKQKGIPLKILTLGDSTVGKSSILVRYTQNKFHQNYLMTVGVDYQSKSVNYNNKKLDLQIWDSAGQEKYRAIAKQYYQKANGILLIYDITSRSSFDGIQDWIEEIQNMACHGTSLILVGNKIDLPNREVEKEEGERLALKNKIKFFETSASDGTNIQKTFDALISDIMYNYEEIKKQDDVLERLSFSPENKRKKKCC